MAKGKESLGPEKAKKIRCIKFKVADPYFDDSYKEHYKKQPKIEAVLATFREYKGSIPPRKLPNGMKDHALNGRLSGINECHLAGNSCLLYTHENDIVTLLYVCDHDDLCGPKEKSIAKMLKNFF